MENGNQNFKGLYIWRSKKVRCNSGSQSLYLDYPCIQEGSIS